MYQLDNDVPLQYTTPPFPSLYWFFGPQALVQPRYLYRIRDVWRFTLYWTLIVFEAAHLIVGCYAVVIVWWGSRYHRSGLGQGRRRTLAPLNEPDPDSPDSKPRDELRIGVKKTAISGMWAVPVLYGLIAGVEAIFTGSIVGWLLGALYDAGGFRMSTWIPFVWALISLLVLIISSFSIQGGL